MTTLIITFQQEGFHKWPSVKNSRDYLGQRHRHTFHFRVEVQVLHQHRELELHDLQELVKQCLWMNHDRVSAFELDFGGDSVETIATELIEDVKATLRLTHGEVEPDQRWWACEVWEDGECGCRVEQRPTRTDMEESNDQG